MLTQAPSKNTSSRAGRAHHKNRLVYLVLHFSVVGNRATCELLCSSRPARLILHERSSFCIPMAVRGRNLRRLYCVAVLNRPVLLVQRSDIVAPNENGFISRCHSRSKRCAVNYRWTLMRCPFVVFSPSSSCSCCVTVSNSRRERLSAHPKATSTPGC